MSVKRSSELGKAHLASGVGAGALWRALSADGAFPPGISVASGTLGMRDQHAERLKSHQVFAAEMRPKSCTLNKQPSACEGREGVAHGRRRQITMDVDGRGALTGYPFEAIIEAVSDKRDGKLRCSSTGWVFDVIPVSRSRFSKAPLAGPCRIGDPASGFPIDFEHRPGGRVVMQRTANPRTPVQFRPRPPSKPALAGFVVAGAGIDPDQGAAVEGRP